VTEPYLRFFRFQPILAPNDDHQPDLLGEADLPSEAVTQSPNWLVCSDEDMTDRNGRDHHRRTSTSLWLAAPCMARPEIDRTEGKVENGKTE
jgi:hypothetical protein